MIKDTNEFKDLSSFINHIKTIKGVVGIVEYGGRKHSNIDNGGDYDLTIIFNESVSENFNGIHFHVNKIPIDCMMLSVEDFKSIYPKDDFYLVHLNCKILYDKDGIVKVLLNEIKDKWAIEESLSESEINLFRFTFRHILDKLQYRLFEDVIYSRYFISSSFDWLLECFARIKKLERGKAKAHLKYIKENEKELYKKIEKLYSTQDLTIQYEMLKGICEYMLESIGGPWKEDEVLFHLMPRGQNVFEEQKRIIERLFNK